MPLELRPSRLYCGYCKKAYKVLAAYETQTGIYRAKLSCGHFIERVHRNAQQKEANIHATT